MERRRNRRFPIQIPVKRWASRRESLFRWAAADFLQCLPHPACVGVAAARFLLREPLHVHNLKTVESTLSQIRRRRARGTSGLWPSSP